MFFYYLFSFYLYGACPVWYGVKDANNSWSFYKDNKPGSVLIEVDSSCKPDHRILSLVDGQYKIDATKKAMSESEDSQDEDKKRQLKNSFNRLKAVDLDQPIDGTQMRQILKDIRAILKEQD